MSCLNFTDIYINLTDFENSLSFVNKTKLIELIYQVLVDNDRETLYETVPNGKKAFSRTFSNNYSKLCSVYYFFEEFETGKGFDKDSTETYQGEEHNVFGDSIFVKTAATPTTIGLSDNYVDEYSDAQSKQKTQGNNDKNGKHTKQYTSNFYEKYLSFINKFPNVTQVILDVFRPLYNNYLI